MPGTVHVGTWEGAEQARAALRQVPHESPVTVVGGGLTGVETASEIAYARPDLNIQLVGPAIGSSLSEKARQRAHTGLERLGVRIHQAHVVEVVARAGAGGADAVRLASGKQLDSELTLWAIIGAASALARRSGLAVDGHGRAIVDEHLRSITDQRVFVVGDCAAVPNARPACATATPQGAHAADTLARLIKGRKLKPYSMGYTGQALSLGRRDGVLMASRRDDTPRRLCVGGRSAALAKEGVNRYAKYGSRTARYGWLRGELTGVDDPPEGLVSTPNREWLLFHLVGLDHPKGSR
jgi:NADH dehydrogenase